MPQPQFREEVLAERRVPAWAQGEPLVASGARELRRVAQGWWRHPRSKLPVILQDETTECGLACVVMVAAYHGLPATLAGVRARAGSLKGSTLKQVLALACSVGLAGRVLRLDPEHLRLLAAPAILHWDLDHFVVLHARSDEGVEIHDPARGRVSLGWTEVSRHFTGYALELSPVAAPRSELAPSAGRLSLGDLVVPDRPLVKFLATLLLLTALLQAAMVASGLFMQVIVDRALPTGTFSLLLQLATGFALLAAARSVLEWLRGLVLIRFSSRVMSQVAGRVMHRLLRLPAGYFERRHIGDVVSRFTSINTIEGLLGSRMVESTIDIVVVVTAFAAMTAYHPALAAVTALFAGLALCIDIGMFRAAREATTAALATSARYSTHFLETTRAVHTLRQFNFQAQRHSQWQNLYTTHLNATARCRGLDVSAQAAVGLVFGLCGVVVVSAGAMVVSDGGMSIGMLLAFLAFKDQFVTRVVGLSHALTDFNVLRIHLDRLGDIMLTEPERLPPPATARAASSRDGGLQTRGLGFRYGATEPWVFRHLDLTVPNGQFLAVTGPSGCGKTTLLKVLAGVLTPTEGSLELGGTDLRELGLAAYRDRIAAVMQDDVLLCGTLAENISFFDAGMLDDRVEACARLAQIHDDISAMPLGYQTPVGDMGSSLSGGQKQRLLLARAAYRAPQVLFLDEATSNLDVATEARINASVRQANMTRFVVAHRPDTLRLADRVLCFETSASGAVALKDWVPA